MQSGLNDAETGNDERLPDIGLLERFNWWKCGTGPRAGVVPEFVSKQKASSLTGIRNTEALQISCQPHRLSETDEDAGTARRRMEV